MELDILCSPHTVFIYVCIRPYEKYNTITRYGSVFKPFYSK